MKNLKATAIKIKKGIKNKEKIILFADADLDGVTSAIILKESIDMMGGDVTVFISNREKWGYGLSKKAVSIFEKEAPAILISLDCGISNFDGVSLAKKMGFFTIIIDHHKVIEVLPDADLILNPHQKYDRTAFKKLANAGIVYYLTKEILKNKFEEKRRRFLELTTLAIIADMVPREADNKEIMNEGFEYLSNTSNIGLSAIRKVSGDNFIDELVSILNITPPVKKINKAYLLLTTDKADVAEEIAKNLKKEMKAKKEQIKKEEKKLLRNIIVNDHFLLVGGSFKKNLGGKLASRLLQKYKKSIFLYTIEEEVGLGSVRTVKGEDAIDAMSYCKNVLDSYGGHPEAAGFRIKLKKVELFRKKLEDYFKKIKNT